MRLHEKRFNVLSTFVMLVQTCGNTHTSDLTTAYIMIKGIITWFLFFLAFLLTCFSSGLSVR
jgi:hypothetical protein